MSRSDSSRGESDPGAIGGPAATQDGGGARIPGMLIAPDTPLATVLHPSPNIEPRRGGGGPDILLLHYTGMHSCQRAIQWLADPRSKVSCHYVIDTDGTVTQMVAESLRAWHAGVGVWAGSDDVNSRSIGIEIHNPGHDQGYPPFPEAQMRAVIALSRDIVRRHAIAPRNVLAHSDIAPTRKIDPGEAFDWPRLAREGVGHWVEPAALAVGDAVAVGEAGLARARRLLASYGYGIAGDADAAATATVVRAFQRHFRPARVDGIVDASTLDTLERLVASAAAAPAPPTA